VELFNDTIDAMDSVTDCFASRAPQHTRLERESGNSAVPQSEGKMLVPAAVYELTVGTS